MSAFYSRLNGATNPLRRQLLIRCLPILVTCLLMLWLSGGLPPRAWITFVAICLQFNSLWTQQGAATLISCGILFAQSLCLLAAWGLWIWAARREILVLQKLWQQERSKQITSGATFSASLPGQGHHIATQKVTAKHTTPSGDSRYNTSIGVTFVPFTAEELNIKPETDAAQETLPFMVTEAVVSNDEIDEHEIPFEEVYADQIGEKASSSFEQTEDIDQAEDISLQSDIFSLNPFEDNEETLSLTEHEVAQAKENSEYLDLDDSFTTPTTKLPVLSMPVIKVQELKDEESSYRENVEKTIQPESEQVETANKNTKGTYIFGNPFEGPQPDIFEHDEDIKRSLQDMQKDLRVSTSQKQTPKK